MEVRKVAFLGSGAIAAGIVLTVLPLVLPLEWKRVDAFLDWPILVVDWRHATWIPRNAGSRVISLLLINVVGWALCFCVCWSAIRRAFRRSNGWES